MRRASPSLAFVLALACGVWTQAACGPPAGPPGSGSSSRADLSKGILLYVGTYTGGASRGIYRLTFDPSSGALSPPVLAGETENPSFLALHPGGRVVYAVNEVDDFQGDESGAVSAFAIDPATHDLRLLNQQPSRGAGPCHLSVDREGRNVLVANYGGGNVAVLPLDSDGQLRPATAVRRHTGSGPQADRQDKPYAHAILLDGAQRLAFSADLGADRIFIDRFGAGAGTLQPGDPDAVGLEPGSGPRHLAWHPSGRLLFAVNELRSTVTVLVYDATTGALRPVQTVPMLPPDFTGENTAAEIAVSADGRFLYASNRGHDSIAILAIDAATSALTNVGFEPTRGRTPRHFAIDPSGRWLLAANQESDTIVVFEIDRASGRLNPVGAPVTVAKPVCILFAPGT